MVMSVPCITRTLFSRSCSGMEYRMGLRSLALWLAGMTVWVIDKFGCNSYLSVHFPYLHSMWHIAAVLATMPVSKTKEPMAFWQICLRPSTKLREGIFFSRVYQFVQGAGPMYPLPIITRTHHTLTAALVQLKPHCLGTPLRQVQTCSL